MSKKKSDKKSDKSPSKKTNQKTSKKVIKETSKAVKVQSRKRTKRTRIFSSDKLVFATVIMVVALALVGCGIGYYFNNIKMEEISTDDKVVLDLTNKYFRGTDACLEYGMGLFTDGTVSTKDMDYDKKEEIAIDYAIRKDYDKVGFSELREVYKLLFNDGSTLQEKLYYESTSGSYKKEGNDYVLSARSACSTKRPPEMVCQVIDKAYKSNSSIKVIAGLYSGTADDQKLYSGLKWEGEPLGIFGEFDPAEKDLEKWEIVYKYNDKLKTYFLDYTKKL